MNLTAKNNIPYYFYQLDRERDLIITTVTLFRRRRRPGHFGRVFTVIVYLSIRACLVYSTIGIRNESCVRYTVPFTVVLYKLRSSWRRRDVACWRGGDLVSAVRRCDIFRI